MTMRLTTMAFTSNSAVPKRYTCDGADVSPPLQWSGAPAETRSFALVCADPDAPAGVWYHWAAYDIPAAMTGLAEHCPPDLADFAQARNDFGKRGYGGPCPPRGHGRHHYRFKLFALDVETLGLGPSAGCRDVEQKAEAHAIATAELVGVYSR
jgi:Raf kinase inhibitor-like YbhB/YbcL family protein